MSVVRTTLAALLMVSAPALCDATPAWQQEEEGAAAEPGALVTDRPDATESPETVGRGRFQLETGYTFASLGEVDVHSVGEFLMRIGVLHENVEFRLAFNSYTLVRGGGSNDGGIQNLGIGAKFRLLSGGGVGHARPTVALLVGTTIPTASEEVEARTARPAARLAAAWDLSEVVSVASNVAWSSVKEDQTDQRHDVWGFSLALGYGLSDRWGAYLEYFGLYPTGERDSENFANTGLTYLINNDLQLDARVGYGLDGRDDDFFVGLGTAIRW
jgi:hypothetical protein